LASTGKGPELPNGTISAADANCWFSDNQSHRFSREGQFHDVAVLMDRRPVFVCVACCQINFVAAYPAPIGIFELGHCRLL
jgi:hypothetical protein